MLAIPAPARTAVPIALLIRAVMLEFIPETAPGVAVDFIPGLFYPLLLSLLIPFQRLLFALTPALISKHCRVDKLNVRSCVLAKRRK